MEVRDSTYDVRIAEHAGTCFGVNNAIKAAFQGANPKNTFILGELVHNPIIVKQLAELGVRRIEDVSALRPGDNLIIRAHGEPEEIFEHCRKNNVKIIDCTCPYVRRVQIMAEQLDKSSYSVVIVGDKGHPEVKGISAKAKNSVVITKPDDISNELQKKPKLGIVCQTTQSKKNFDEIVNALDSNGKQLEIHNTICNATQNRQDAALKLCEEVDTMIVIGGKNSANTRRLYELCSQKASTLWITSPDELDWEKIKGVIGITAGASTPHATIQEIKAAISKKSF